MSSTIPQLLSPGVDVLPGDPEAATAVDGWLREYATSRDPALRQRIILAYVGLADRLAGRYRHSRGSTPEDLVQTARAGLIAAVDRYDPDYGNPFVPYAVACVVGELKRHLRDTSWRLHVPRQLKEQALRLCQWVIPALTGAVLVLNARMGEQQRPAQITGGLLGRLRPGRAA